MDKWNGNNSPLPNCVSDNNNLQLDIAARFHRSAASLYDATYTWSGVLPPRSNVKPIGYSSKVFLGGIPWDVSEQLLIQTFKQFGPIRVEWPGKDKQASQPKGYVYIIFESEKNVRALLQACTNDFANSGNWYFKITSKRMKAKEVSNASRDIFINKFISNLSAINNMNSTSQNCTIFHSIPQIGLAAFPILAGGSRFFNHTSRLAHNKKVFHLKVS